MNRIACLLAVALGGCGPQEGTAFRGDEQVQIAILCPSRVIGTTPGYWMTVTVRHRPGVEVDWAGSRLETDGAVIDEREAGAVRKARAGWVKRRDTFWVRGRPEATSRPCATIGPFFVRYRAGGGEWSEARSEICEPGLPPRRQNPPATRSD